MTSDLTHPDIEKDAEIRALAEGGDMTKFAKLSEIKAGSRLVADGGFDCIEQGTILIVCDSGDGLYVPCACGEHYLEGQLDFDDDDTLIGLSAFDRAIAAAEGGR
ncbi:hypothetical protein ACN6KF_001485 [Labrys sp. La1]|uniref:hypothetical protein n=1 Tax=Labrys sp. La1 TaxID=3404917 RepID=UPI003EBBCE4D